MSEKITVEFQDLTLMAEDALDFFADEIRQGNNISINAAGKVIEIATIRDWDTYLINAGIVKREIKKDIRI